MTDKSNLPQGLDCSICYDIFTAPRSLSCGHTFCTGCLELVANNNNKEGLTQIRSIACPKCRRETSIYSYSGGIHGLPINFQVQTIADQFRCFNLGCSMNALHGTVKKCHHCACNYCEACYHDHQRKLIEEVEERVRRLETISQSIGNKPALEKTVRINVQNVEKKINQTSDDLLKTIKSAVETKRIALTNEARQIGKKKIDKIRTGNFGAFEDIQKAVNVLASEKSMPNFEKVLTSLNAKLDTWEKNVTPLMASNFQSEIKVDFDGDRFVQTFLTSLEKDLKITQSPQGEGRLVVETFDLIEPASSSSLSESSVGTCGGSYYFECLTCWGERSAFLVCKHCAEEHHTGHELKPSTSNKKFFKNKNKKNVFCACGRAKHCLNVCTRSLISKANKKAKQACYICEDCFDVAAYRRENDGSTPGICFACSKRCHSDHRVTFYRYSDSFSCDCGLVDSCKIPCEAV